MVYLCTHSLLNCIPLTTENFHLPESENIRARSFGDDQFLHWLLDPGLGYHSVHFMVGTARICVGEHRPVPLVKCGEGKSYQAILATVWSAVQEVEGDTKT